MKISRCLCFLMLFGMTLTGCKDKEASSEQVDTRDPQILQVYAEYQQNGGTLSYDEWLASIKGEKGDKGDKGDTGETGPQGDQGPQGDIGPQGPAGQNGADGVSVVSIEKTGNDGLVDTYTITYSNNTTSTFTVTNGANGQNGADGATGAQGIQGNPGADGHSPVITIGGNGNWFVDNEDTGIHAQGIQGETGPEGPQGDIGPQGPAGQNGADGVSVVSIEKTGNDGLVDTYTITYSNNTTSTFTVTNGANGQNGADGATGAQGIQGNPGVDGHTPSITIGGNGNWFVDDEDTGIHAQGIQGEIGPQGPQGEQGNPGADGSTILSGSGDPLNTLGKDGDMYLNTSSYDVFEKVDGEWILSCNIKGLKGDTGVSVIDTEIDENGDLIVTFSNDQVVNAGHVKDVTKYTVNFYVDDDLVVTRTVEPNSKIEAPSLEETAGYTINSWHVEGYNDRPWVFEGYYADRVTESVNLYADFSYNEYTISFVDEKFNKEIESITVTYDHEYSFEKNLSQAGYTFTGWKEQNAESLYANSGVFRHAGNITLYSLWDVNTYHVSLNPNGGTCEISEKDIIFDTKYILPIPTREHYTFLGWYLDDEYVSSNATWKFDFNCTLTAKWSNNLNQYLLDAGDGSCEVQFVEIYWDEPYSLPIPTIDKVEDETAYYFVGWSVNGEIIPTEGDEWTFSSDDHIIYANYSNNLSLELKNNAYYYAKNCINKDIKEINFPVSLDYPLLSIGYDCFGGCDQLESINIPDSVTSIGPSAFSGCSSLKTVKLPENLTTIQSSCFYNCSALESINLPQTLETIKCDAFNNCSSLVSVDFPQALIKIEDSGFNHCSSLTSIVFPDGFKTIGDYAFCDCSSLKSIYLSDTVESIGAYAFSYCSSQLRNIFIPKSVKTIKSCVFYRDTKTNDVTVYFEGTEEYVEQNCTRHNNWYLLGYTDKVGYVARCNSRYGQTRNN